MMTINPTSKQNAAGDIVTHITFSGNPSESFDIKMCPADQRAVDCEPIDTTDDSEWSDIETTELVVQFSACMESGNENTTKSVKRILAMIMGINAQLNRTANTSKTGE